MELQRGEVLFLQEEQGELFRLRSGLLKVVRIQEDGSQMLFNILVPGEVFPHHSLITPKEYFGSVIAMLPSQLDRIPAGKWYKDLENDPRKYKEVALLLQNTIRQMQQRIEMNRVSIELRIPLFRKWLAVYCPHHPVEELLTQEEIGQFLGMSRETVNRLLRKERRLGE